MASQLADERTPLLVERQEQQKGILNEDILRAVDFDPNGDPENPLDWSPRFKWGIVAMLAFTSFTVTFNCMSVIPVARHIIEDLDGINAPSSAPVLLITIWELGEAIGPLLIGPLSEAIGRYPMINATNMLFIFATALAAVSQNTSLFIASRALTGMAVASNVLNPAIIGDIFDPEQRGRAMSLIMFAPLLGGTMGPALSGFISQSLGWRCVLWVCIALAGIYAIVFFACFRETYSVAILRQRSASLRKEMGNIPITYSFAEGLAKGSAGLWLSIMRPTAVLFDSGVLTALALFGSIIFALSYVLSVTLPGILEEIYGLSPAAVGSAFMAQGIGSFISLLICNFSLDRVYVKLRRANNGISLPEHRLPMTILGAVTLPPALALYGWCAEYKLPLTLFLLSVVCIYFSLLLVILPLIAYVVDASGLYSASALTGVITLRCLAAAFLPLSMTPIVEHLGYGWGFTALASFSLVLALVPVLVQRYGPRWRRHSKYTRGW